MSPFADRRRRRRESPTWGEAELRDPGSYGGWDEPPRKRGFRSWVPVVFGLMFGPGLAAWAVLVPVVVETNTPVRVMAANLTGDSQSYQAPAIRIFQGLKPDVVAIQEFRYLQNRPADFRALVDTAFGTHFVYFREPGYDSGIPNGVISRFPILASGTWPSGVNNRGFAWARLDVPGTNELVAVSIHFKAGSSDAGRSRL